MRSLSTFLLLVALPVVAGAQVTASLRVDPARIAVGETAELSVEVEGEQGVSPPSIPAPDGLRVDYRGQSTQVSIVNGRMTATSSHTYGVTALRPGTYTIGPVRLEHEGRTIDAGTVRLLVVAGGGATGRDGATDDTLRLVASVPKRRVYLHEPLQLTVRLEVRGVRVTDLQYPTLNADGLTVRGFPEPEQRRERRAGGVVDVVEFESEVVPARSGKMTIGPVTMQLSVVLRARPGTFFGSMFDRRQPRTVVAEPIDLEVMPLPIEGRPDGFGGAVGRFTLDVTAAPTTVDAGDPVTLGITVSGTGSLAQARAPAVPAVPGLKVYDPAEPEAARRDGAIVTRRFEQVVIPERAGTVALPPVELSYFDPSTERYVTTRGSNVVLTVRPGPKQAPAVVVGDTMRQPVAPPEELGRDIVFIKDDPGRLAPIGSAPYRSPAFWAAQLVPLLALGVVVAWDRRRSRLGANPKLARFAGAGATARRALAAGGSAPDAVARAYVEYLGAKLDLAPGAVVPEEVRARLLASGVGAALVAEAIALLEACEHERYRPSAKDDGAGLLDRAGRVVSVLERERGIAPPAIVLLALLVGVGTVVASETPKTLFFRGNALYADGRFAEAAAAWEQVLATGLESGPLEYNLGNAHLRAGDRGRAVLAYERAWRLIPGDADLMANLRFAKEDADPTEGMPLAARLALPLAPRVATARLAVWAAAAWWVLLTALIVGRLVPRTRRAGRVVAVVAAVGLGLTASAAAYRFARVDAPDWAVVLHDAEVRFEPTASGTVHYEAPLGTVVEILGERGGWARVARRSDGLRGWIERPAVATLRPAPDRPDTR